MKNIKQKLFELRFEKFDLVLSGIWEYIEWAGQGFFVIGAVLLWRRASVELKLTVTGLVNAWQDVGDCQSQLTLCVCVPILRASVSPWEYVCFLCVCTPAIGFGVGQLLVVVSASHPPTQRPYCKSDLVLVGTVLCLPLPVYKQSPQGRPSELK